jgi:hypothetical protein
MWDNQNQQTGHIPEDFVQNKSLEYLRQKYKGSFLSFRSVNALLEVNTIEGKRADGLLYYKNGKSYFTASLEAKSYGTISALRPKVDEYAFSNRAALFLAIVALSFLFAVVFLDVDYVPIMIFLCAGIVLYFISFNKDSDKSGYLYSEVMRQIEQYPANERWLAVAEDCFDEKMTIDDLKKICNKCKVGLLCVNYQGKVKMLVNPIKQGGDYLPFYSNDSRLNLLQ